MDYIFFIYLPCSKKFQKIKNREREREREREKERERALKEVI